VNLRHCCESVFNDARRGMSGMRIASGDPPPPTPVRHLRQAIRWIVPGGILALLPKCPACLAAYFAVIGGIGISVTAATYLRLVLVALCVVSLSYAVASRGRHREITQ